MRCASHHATAGPAHTTLIQDRARTAHLLATPILETPVPVVAVPILVLATRTLVTPVTLTLVTLDPVTPGLDSQQKTSWGVPFVRTARNALPK